MGAGTWSEALVRLVTAASAASSGGSSFAHRRGDGNALLTSPRRPGHNRYAGGRHQQRRPPMRGGASPSPDGSSLFDGVYAKIAVSRWGANFVAEGESSAAPEGTPSGGVDGSAAGLEGGPEGGGIGFTDGLRQPISAVSSISALSGAMSGLDVLRAHPLHGGVSNSSSSSGGSNSGGSNSGGSQLVISGSRKAMDIIRASGGPLGGGEDDSPHTPTPRTVSAAMRDCLGGSPSHAWALPPFARPTYTLSTLGPIHVTGPFGAPSVQLENYSHFLLIAGGIGITPIASLHYALVAGLPVRHHALPSFPTLSTLGAGSVTGGAGAGGGTGAGSSWLGGCFTSCCRRRRGRLASSREATSASSSASTTPTPAAAAYGSTSKNGGDTPIAHSSSNVSSSHCTPLPGSASRLRSVTTAWSVREPGLVEAFAPLLLPQMRGAPPRATAAASASAHTPGGKAGGVISSGKAGWEGGGDGGGGADPEAGTMQGAEGAFDTPSIDVRIYSGSASVVAPPISHPAAGHGGSSSGGQQLHHRSAARKTTDPFEPLRSSSNSGNDSGSGGSSTSASGDAPRLPSSGGSIGSNLDDIKVLAAVVRRDSDALANPLHFLPSLTTSTHSGGTAGGDYFGDGAAVKGGSD